MIRPGQTALKTKEAVMKKIKLIFSLILIFSGIALASYPVISNMLAQKNASLAIMEYNAQVETIQEEKLDAAKEAIRQYNEQLGKAVLTEEENDSKAAAGRVELIDAGEILGYLTIPVIDLNLPVYYGTSASVLEKGVGYMEESSFPLGGESTHCVLTGHRGLPSAELFTHMDKVAKGDQFYIHILDEILAYEVDQIKVVEPELTDDLEIIPGKDYTTLVTCTPYSINTHRLLVRGHRVPYTGEEKIKTKSQIRPAAMARRVFDVWPWFLIMLAGIVILEAAIIAVMLFRRWRKRKNNRK